MIPGTPADHLGQFFGTIELIRWMNSGMGYQAGLSHKRFIEC